MAGVNSDGVTLRQQTYADLVDRKLGGGRFLEIYAGGWLRVCADCLQYTNDSHCDSLHAASEE